MATFFSRRYQRGGPGRRERVIGALVLVLIGVVLGAFLLTSGLLAGVVQEVSILRGLKDWIGIDERPLFEVAEGDMEPPAVSRELRVAGMMLPELKERWQRLAVAAFSVQAGRTAELADAAMKSFDWAGRAWSTDAELIEQIEAAGARWVYLGLYRDPEDTANRNMEYQALVTIVDVGEPEKAFGLWQACDPGATMPMSAGRGGWIVNTSGSCGFWAGRYYTELVGSLSGGRLEDLAERLAGVQLVYGGPFDREEPKTTPDKTAPPEKPVAKVAGFADVPGGNILSPAKIERYTDNLYEKIDGKEGMFRAYLFVELRFGQYQDSRSQAVYDVYLFDMGDPANAFGIFMAERSPQAEVLPVGRDGYCSGGSVFFFKDKYYVNVLGPEDGGEDVQAVSKQIADAVADTITDEAEPFWADKYLATDDRVDHSFRYYATSALGYDFLERMFQADYQVDGKEYQLFLTQAADAAAAATLFEKFVEATAKYDKVASNESLDGGRLMVGESLGVFSVAFNKGVFFGGVVECEDQTLAREKAIALRDRLGGTSASY